LILEDETGVLVDPGAPEQLAKALETLVRNPRLRRDLGLAAAKRVRAEFSTDPGLDRLAAKFRKVV